MKPAKRISRSLALARRVPFEPRAAAKLLADLRSLPGYARKHGDDVLKREIAPLLPGLHLSAAIVAGRGAFDHFDPPLPSEMCPREVPRLSQERRHRLTARVGPKVAGELDEIMPALLGMTLDTRWIYHVLDAAEHWRHAIGRPELIEVRCPLWLP